MSKRIGIDCRLWNKTGVGRYVSNLVRILQTKDTQNQYFLFAMPEEYENILSTLTNRNFTVVSVNIGWHSWSEQLLFPLKLMEYRLDLMHFPYFSFPFLYPRKFIITIHDMIPWTFATGKASTLPTPFYWGKQLAYKFLEVVGSRRAAAIIAVSESTKKDIVMYLKINPEKVFVTYEGVEGSITLRKNSVRKTTIFTDLGIAGKKYFLAIGNFYPHKNLERLVVAFDQLQKMRKDIFLVLVGKKDFFSNRLEQFIREKNITNVIFAGFVPDEDMAQLFNKTVATVYPSLAEGFGLPALEALSNECLVICSRIPVLEEVCGDAVLYCDPYDSDDIAGALEAALHISLKEKEEKLATGIKILRKFSWSKMADETVRLYHQLV